MNERLETAIEIATQRRGLLEHLDQTGWTWDRQTSLLLDLADLLRLSTST
jgi:hypothetical protein